MGNFQNQEDQGGVDKIDKWKTGENIWEGYCYSRGGYLPLPGFALWVERMMDQGQGGARGRGQGCGEARRGDRAGQAGEARPTYPAGVQVHL